MDDVAPTQEREAPARSDRNPGERPRTEEGGDAQGEARDQNKNPSKSGDQKNQKKEGQRKRWPLIALAVAIVVAAIGGLIEWLLTKDLAETDDAYTDGRAVLVAPHVSGYATQLLVNDNQFVHKGDLLVQVDPRDYIASRDEAAAQRDTSEAQLGNARVALEKARTVYPAQLALAQARVEEAKGRLFLADAEYKRQHAVQSGATTQQDIDSATANRDVAQGQMQEAQAQLDQAQLVQQNIAQAEAQVVQLQAQVEQAQSRLDQAELNLSYTHVTAPQDGWVAMRNVEVGNYLQPGAQIMALVTPEVWVTANFKETQIDRMRPGQKVRIAVDSFPDLKLDGHVDSIQLGSGQKFTTFPPENATGNWVKIVQRVPVKIVIDHGLDPHRPLPLGVSVEPTVTLK